MVTIKVEKETKYRIKKVAQELGITIARLLEVVFELNVYEFVVRKLVEDLKNVKGGVL